MQWVNGTRVIDGVQRPVKILNFAIEAGTEGGIVLSNSNGIIPDATGDFLEFNPLMFERFDITIDQLEGEINCPYIFQRLEPEIEEDDEIISNTEIIVPHSLLGGFVQFRINYQFIYYPSDPLASRILTDLDDDGQLDGIVYNGSVTTPRTIVPRYVAPPPPPPPPIFEIDDGQIKEAIADKIYEKFFTTDVIEANLSDVLSLQTTTSEDGVGYETGRTSEDQQLIIFKKDRNTPENKRDFEGDGSDGIQLIANSISSSLSDLGEDALINLIVSSSTGARLDLSEYLENQLQIDKIPQESNSRIPSIDLNPPIEAPNSPGESAFYVDITRYEIRYQTAPGNIVTQIPFAELWKYYDQTEGDDKQQIFDDEGNQIDRPDEWKNKLNLSQLTLVKPSNRIDQLKATQTLDTNIFELLPNQNQRQLQIDNFFDLFNQLIGTAPSFDDGNADNIPETITDEPDDLERRITLAPTNAGAFITRADKDIQLGLESDDPNIIQSAETNEGKTLEGMRNRLNQFLLDVDSVVEEVDDSRPEYENQSSGFLKLRRLNQSILIKGPSETPSFGNWTEDGFTITMWVRFLNTTGGGSLFTYGNPMMRTKSSFRLETMTVQEGDMATFNVVDGEINPLSFYNKSRRVIRLVVWEDRREDPWWQEKILNSEMDWINPDSGNPMNVGGLERQAGYTWDSSVPYDIPNDSLTLNSFSAGFSKLPTWFTQMPANLTVKGSGIRPPFNENFLQYTDVPTDDLQEWFFVCATYDPTVKEINSFGSEWDYSDDGYSGTWPLVPYGSPTDFMSDHPDNRFKPGELGFQNSGGNNGHLKDELFWLGHKDLVGNTVSRSGFGNRCKVEIISRSDLLRARGYRV